MGDWAITLHGVGAHHNGAPFDIEHLAQAFVRTLRAEGHSLFIGVVHAGGSAIQLDLAPHEPAAPPSDPNKGLDVV